MAAREPAPVADVPKQATAPARETTHSSTTLLLVLVTLAGAWLRLSHLGSKSLWLDEGATVALARASWQHFAWVWWYGEDSCELERRWRRRRCWPSVRRTCTTRRKPAVIPWPFCWCCCLPTSSCGRWKRASGATGCCGRSSACLRSTVTISPR